MKTSPIIKAEYLDILYEKIKNFTNESQSLYQKIFSFLSRKPQGFPSIAGMLFKLSLLGLLVSGKI